MLTYFLSYCKKIIKINFCLSIRWIYDKLGLKEYYMKYDYLIVGAGLFGATVAHELTKLNKKCLVIDKRNHIGGNIYCENIEGIDRKSVV